MLNGINLLIRNLILAAICKLLNTNINFGVSILSGFRTDVIVPTYVIDANIESPMNLLGYRTYVILLTYVIDANIELSMNLLGYHTDVILSTYVIDANIESPMNLLGYRTDVILPTYVIDSNIESPMNLRSYRTDVILSTYVINTQHTTLIATILMKEAMLIFSFYSPTHNYVIYQINVSSERIYRQ